MASWLQALERVLDLGLPATTDNINKTAEEMSKTSTAPKQYSTRTEYIIATEESNPHTNQQQ